MVDQLMINYSINHYSSNLMLWLRSWARFVIASAVSIDSPRPQTLAPVRIRDTDYPSFVQVKLLFIPVSANTCFLTLSRTQRSTKHPPASAPTQQRTHGDLSHMTARAIHTVYHIPVITCPSPRHTGGSCSVIGYRRRPLFNSRNTTPL